MPLTSVARYTTPEQMEAAYSAAHVETAPTGRGPFSAHVIRLELDHIWLVRVHETAPRIERAVPVPNRVFIVCQINGGSELIITDGVALRANEVIYFNRPRNLYRQFLGPVDWLTISMPVEDMTAAGIAIAGRDLGRQPCRMRIAVSPDSMARLQNLQSDVAELVEKAPEVELGREVAHGLEQALIAAAVDCLSGGEIVESTRAQQHHQTVMHRFNRLLESDPDRAFYVPEICAAIGVPERTLRLCCQEHLGMRPKQYLLLRRMHLARRALLAATAVETTITGVATHYGFWHLGRFAGCYQSMFGELPSTTLNRPPQ
jgi:AraC-like DNA-binding protein